MPNNAEAARKRRMKARICGNCEQPAQDMRRWGGPQIPICRVCAAVLDTLQTQLRHRTIEDKTIWEPFEAGIEAGNSGDPCLPSSEYRTSRSAVVLWVDGWLTGVGDSVQSVPSVVEAVVDSDTPESPLSTYCSSVLLRETPPDQGDKLRKAWRDRFLGCTLSALPSALDNRRCIGKVDFVYLHKWAATDCQWFAVCHGHRDDGGIVRAMAPRPGCADTATGDEGSGDVYERTQI